MADNKNKANNLDIGLEIVKAEYESTLSRFKELDNKLNMLLVFAAGELAAWGGTISSFNLEYHYKLAYIIISLLLFLPVVITILVGLFTRYLDLLNTDDLNKSEIIESDKFIKRYIEAYNISIESIEKQNKKKSKLFNISVCLILIPLIPLIVLIIIDLVL